RAIWALGVRNPFTFAVQPGTGQIYINDVGENTWEEINVGVAGANYGWSTIEGFRTTQTPPANYHDPLFAYHHPTTGADPTTVGRVSAVAPTVSSIRINDGSGQRSMVTSITVTFTRPVSLDAGAFTLVGRNDAGAGTVVNVALAPDSFQVATLTFTGAPIVGG